MDCPERNVCGHGTYQCPDAGAKSEMSLIPVALLRDPNVKGRNKLVLYELFRHDCELRDR
ncbi:hypothetical protein IscW_ISCW021564 [Ixodes scapularis]|uniref:Uncharacterized protein n=1 Tax=Ixodes scapularis TaxID=6945 RepID=B7Q6K3_IXOSC|nr:hypothetical protein IscW_ISCW021564 [Ixodes scapularis]|eukprot:XP_002411986.1 hypothetical protein IscW_ISCW021564 [Ixodes scapularis]